MRSISLCASLLVAGAGVASGDELYRQDPVNTCGGLSSQDARNAGGLGWFSEAADNFPGGAGWSIDEVHFWGGYCMPPGQEGNTEGFTVRFYTDNGGQPGTRVYEQDVFTFTEDLYNTQVGGLGGYLYTVQLPTAFEIDQSGQYWVSVVALLARGGGSQEPQWGWARAPGITPPPSHQWFFDPGNFAPQNEDSSFVLFGTISTGCDADLDGDGDADGDDFFMFLDLFVAGDDAADLDDDGDRDGDDFFLYLDLFASC